MALPGQALAQSGDGSVAIGANIGLRSAIGPESRGGKTLGFIWRLGRGQDGWGIRYGLNWYSTHLQTEIDDEQQAFGEMKVRPLMGGYGYGRRFGRTFVSANMLAGVAFTSFSLSDAADRAYRSKLLASSLHADATHPFVVRPEVSAWIDVSRRIGVNISAGYTFARPHVTIEGPGGKEERRVRADMFTVKIGAVYSIF